MAWAIPWQVVSVFLWASEFQQVYGSLPVWAVPLVVVVSIRASLPAEQEWVWWV